MKLLKFEGLLEPPPALQLPLLDPQVLEPDPDTEPESAEEVDMAEEREVGPWPGWQPLQEPRTLPPSMEEAVVLPQLKSPRVEGGPSL